MTDERVVVMTQLLGESSVAGMSTVHVGGFGRSSFEQGDEL